MKMRIENRMRTSTIAIAACAAAAALVGCGGDEEMAGEGGDEVRVVQTKLSNGFTLTGCSNLEAQRINSAFGVLLNVVGPGSAAFKNCIQSASLVEFSCPAGQGRDDIFDDFVNTSVTNITCASLAPSVSGDAPVGISGTQLRLDHAFLNGTSSGSVIASVVAHEIMHNRGYSHQQNPFGTTFNPNTVPEQVEQCVLAGFPNSSRGTFTRNFDDRCDKNPYQTTRGTPGQPLMHACPVGMYMTGAYVGVNAYLCKSFPGRTYTAAQEFTDVGSSVLGMHGCGEGFAMTGMYAGVNKLLCAPFANQGTQVVEKTTVRQDMRACPLDQVMAGFHGANNWIICAP